ncbi:hypothetical protein AXG93_4491s1080 [Marchantia polymorpha subsp. ruderalis]|uniref:Uncharacterized protein n=1 Tax=Marchantia polymorpha subsp. ruderalis TaxID=1480154 RepID=A0A176WQC7_MARPO|nr:hypothetical protein AXG93_4491s1080 [Marchantia polymorpha subsp. ruderalis]
MRLAPDIYNEGPLTVDLFSVSTDALSGHKHRRSSKEAYAALKLTEDPPRPLLIAAPKTAGSYHTFPGPSSPSAFGRVLRDTLIRARYKNPGAVQSSARVGSVRSRAGAFGSDLSEFRCSRHLSIPVPTGIEGDVIP